MMTSYISRQSYMKLAALGSDWTNIDSRNPWSPIYEPTKLSNHCCQSENHVAMIINTKVDIVWTKLNKSANTAPISDDGLSFLTLKVVSNILSDT